MRGIMSVSQNRLQGMTLAVLYAAAGLAIKYTSKTAITRNERLLPQKDEECDCKSRVTPVKGMSRD